MRVLDRQSTMDLTCMGVELTVHFDFQPEEAADHYGDAPYPGCPAQVDISEVYCGTVDITALLDIDVIHALECKVLEMRDE